MMRRSSVVALGLLVCLATPKEAKPCSPPPPGLERVRPDPNMIVPRNADILATGWVSSPVQAEFFEIDFFSNLEVETLPSFAYGGLFIVDIGTIAAGGYPISVRFSDEEGSIVSERYETSIEDDIEPPGPVGVVVRGTEVRESEPGLCEPGGTYINIFVPEVFDDWGMLLYRVVADDGDTVMAVFPPSPQLEGRMLSVRTSPGKECFRVHARDLGGNESISDRFCLNPQIPDAGVADAVTPDAKTPDAGDGGTIRDAQARDSGGGLLKGGDEGCGCTTSGDLQDGAPAFWFLVGGLLFATRRRR